LKWLLVIAWMATLAAAGGIGHHMASRVQEEDPAPARGVEARLSEGLHDRDLLTRTYRLSESLRHLDESNIEAAAAVLEAQRVGVTPAEVRLFMFAWCRVDPSGAYGWGYAWEGPWRATLT
jgi:hypothetical protein